MLVAVDDANEHVITVWDWQKGEKGQIINETKVCISVKSHFICGAYLSYVTHVHYCFQLV